MDLLNAMRAFARVYETGSFGDAAKGLGLRERSVSKLIGHLEGQVDEELFRRSSDGLTATAAGVRFYARALRAIEFAERSATPKAGTARGVKRDHPTKKIKTGRSRS